MSSLRVTVWNEGRHERQDEAVQAIYPEGMHEVLAGYLRGLGELEVATATLDDEEQGLPEETLAATDVLVWWGHRAHDEVNDGLAERVCRRVWDGMGFIALHSAHVCKPFLRLMGTSCGLYHREAGEKERLWVVDPGHPIVRGIGRYFELPQEEMYGEFYDVPPPDELVLVSWFAGGEVFRSGMTWRRGKGKVFYFRPGHETYPTYHDSHVLRIIGNAVRWAGMSGSAEIPIACQPQAALEDLPS